MIYLIQSQSYPYDFLQNTLKNKDMLSLTLIPLVTRQ